MSHKITSRFDDFVCRFLGESNSATTSEFACESGRVQMTNSPHRGLVPFLYLRSPMQVLTNPPRTPSRNLWSLEASLCSAELLFSLTSQTDFSIKQVEGEVSSPFRGFSVQTFRLLVAWLENSFWTDELAPVRMSSSNGLSAPCIAT